MAVDVGQDGPSCKIGKAVEYGRCHCVNTDGRTKLGFVDDSRPLTDLFRHTLALRPFIYFQASYVGKKAVLEAFKSSDHFVSRSGA